MSQILTLTIDKSSSPGRDNHFVFDECGGSIGRNHDNDFVLLDPNHYLSRKHALISYQDGAYHLTDISENGVFLNHSNQPLGKNNSVRLGDGDCLSLGDYELIVSIEQTESEAIPGQHEAGPGPSPSPWGAEQGDEFIPDILDGGVKHDVMPDFPKRDSKTAHSKSDMQPAAEPDDSPAEQDFFMPPSTHEESPQLDWDKTGFAPAADGESQSPDWDKTDFVTPVRPEEQVPHEGDSVDSAATHTPPRLHKQTEPAPKPATAGVQSSEYKSAAVSHASSAVSPASSSTGHQAGPETSALGVGTLQAFLQGAGLNAEQLSPEAAEALMNLQGKLYREIVHGMMDVLRARFDLKNEFRMRQTQIQIKENNPLKFIGQVDDALEYLVLKRSPGFLPPGAAFHEAFQDIKDHQIAMVVGMRAAFESLLQRFDPEYLERRFTKGNKIDSLVPMYKNANCWERYQEWYADIAATAQDDFQGLFGNEFARAYEDQMARLALLRKRSD